MVVLAVYPDSRAGETRVRGSEDLGSLELPKGVPTSLCLF